jgi:trimethylamine--corrinoid protein Co-methyltransferase
MSRINHIAELTYHPVQSILDDDIAGMVGRFAEGVEVSEETMALGLIEKVGPSPGHYLDKEHTIKWWRKEQFIPKAADSTGYAE